MAGIREKLEVMFGVSGADKFKKEFEDADRSVQKSSKGMTGAMKAIGAAAVAYLSVQTVKALGEAVFSMSKLSDEMRVVQTSNQRLAKSIGQSSTAILAAIRRGVGGAVDDLTILKQVNQAILLGIPVTAREMENMATVATRLGRAVGRDAASALGDLVTGIGRMSPLILDNLGITIKLEEAYAKLGENATDAEKKIAFFNAVMEKAGRLSNTLGEQTISVGEKWDQVMTKVKNGSAVFGAFVTPAINIAIDKLSKLVDIAAKVPNAVAYLTTGSSDIAYSTGIDDPILRTEARIKELEDRLRGAIAVRRKNLDQLATLGLTDKQRTDSGLPSMGNLKEIGFLGEAIAIQQDNLRRLRGQTSISPYRSMGSFTAQINPAISERRSQSDIDFDAATVRMFEAFNNGKTFDMEPQIRDMTKDLDAGFKMVAKSAKKDLREIPLSMEEQMGRTFANMSVQLSALGLQGVGGVAGGAGNLLGGLSGFNTARISGTGGLTGILGQTVPALQAFTGAVQLFSAGVGLFKGAASFLNRGSSDPNKNMAQLVAESRQRALDNSAPALGGRLRDTNAEIAALSARNPNEILNPDDPSGDTVGDRLRGLRASLVEIAQSAQNAGVDLNAPIGGTSSQTGSNAYSVTTSISETQANSILAVLETQRAQDAERNNLLGQSLAVQTDMKFLMSINSGNLLTFAG